MTGFVQSVYLQSYSLFRGGGPYHMKTSPLFCSVNQWTGFYMITTLVMKELNKSVKATVFPYPWKTFTNISRPTYFSRNMLKFITFHIFHLKRRKISNFRIIKWCNIKNLGWLCVSVWGEFFPELSTFR